MNDAGSLCFTPLFMSMYCLCPKLSTVKLLMEFGAKVNHADGLGFTPLFQATGISPVD